jgi:diguanylate cyclase (GGDEF)-like protein
MGVEEREGRLGDRRATGKDAAVAASDWPTQQLTEFLALIASHEDEESVLTHGIERIAESLRAEAAVLISGGAVVASVGVPAGEAPAGVLAVATSGHGTMTLPGLGECPTLSVKLPGAPVGRVLVARRPEAPFQAPDIELLDGMARVIDLRLQTIRLLAEERAHRSISELQAAENSRLLGALRERQGLLERLSEIQRAIVRKRPLHAVLEAIVEGACELLGDDVGTLRLAGPNDPAHTTVVASVGGSPELLAPRRRSEAGEGLGGKAMRERRLVIADQVSGPEALDDLGDFAVEGLTAAMAAPVHEGGEVIGSLGVASTEPGRTYGARDQGVLLAFAEHASLVLGHARAHEEALHEALHDSLTGLPNRTLLVDRLSHALARARRSGTRVGVLFCDLDGFKTVNDSLGHAAGDQLLVQVGERLRDCLRPSDTVARLGGDEFAILLDELADPRDAARAARRVNDALEAPFHIRGRDIYIGASIGIAAETREAEGLLRNANLAMYRAKGEGRGRYAVFEPAMHTAAVERLELETELTAAIDRGELALVYQPIFTLRTGAIAGMEALVRWQHPTRGLVMPERFVPMAEQSGQIRALSRWVMSAACHQGALWRAKYPAHPGLQVGVNVSGAQLRAPGLVEEVREALSNAGLEAEGLTIEITETALMENLDVSVPLLEGLKELGVEIAIDDFGSGYSSLRYLKRLPLDSLKIEKFFVDGIGQPDEEPALLRAIVDLAEIFDLRPVAEGIERPEQPPRLLELGCEMGQGHLLSEPLGAEDADALLLRVGLLGSPAGAPKLRSPATDAESTAPGPAARPRRAGDGGR